jgi:hypothetical protein
MTSAVNAESGFDQTALPGVLRQGTLLGVFQSACVLAFSVVYRFMEGPLELVLAAVVVLAGLVATTAMPGLWTRARTIEGIAGAAGIGLWAAVIFLIIDVAALQPLGTYTNRWHEIGGGSNWWYHPVWWMVGSFLPWMGALIIANTAAKGGTPSIAGIMLPALGLTLLTGILAVVTGFPGAAWGLGTFAVAFLPGLTIAAALSAVGVRRRVT